MVVQLSLILESIVNTYLSSGLLVHITKVIFVFVEFVETHDVWMVDRLDYF